MKKFVAVLSSFVAFTGCSHMNAKAGDVTAPGGLAGTYLTAPSKASPPQVLILAGSGPTDRNGNSPLGVSAQSYRLLADGLSAAGIASTRVDKRGMFASAAGASDPNSVFISQLAQDAHAWAREIKSRTGARCVWLAGHSEGGLVALLAAQNPTDICGLILIATPGRKLGVVLREQLSANPANTPILTDALATLAALEGGNNVDVSKLHPALQTLFNPVVQGFIKDLLQINPVDLIANYNGEILIVQGAADLQVGINDGRALAAAQPRAKLIELANVNHVLKQTGPERGANFASYTKPDLPIAPSVVTSIAAFIHEN